MSSDDVSLDPVALSLGWTYEPEADGYDACWSVPHSRGGIPWAVLATGDRYVGLSGMCAQDVPLHLAVLPTWQDIGGAYADINIAYLRRRLELGV